MGTFDGSVRNPSWTGALSKSVGSWEEGRTLGKPPSSSCITGFAVMSRVGAFDGFALGNFVGEYVGLLLGYFVGIGLIVGAIVGAADGTIPNISWIASRTSIEGLWDGSPKSDMSSWEGAAEGATDGIVDGVAVG